MEALTSSSKAAASNAKDSEIGVLLEHVGEHQKQQGRQRQGDILGFRRDAD